MIRPLLILTALAALAGPAVADVKVSLAGKDAAAIRADVTSAAQTACLEEIRNSMAAFALYGHCLMATVRTAMDQIDAARARPMASADQSQ